VLRNAAPAVNFLLIVVVLALALNGAPSAFAARARAAEVSSPTVEGDPYKGGTLRCSETFGDGPVSFGWKRDGEVVTGATAETYVVSGADVGHYLACAATIVEGGLPMTVQSASVEIVHLITTVADHSHSVQRGAVLTLRGEVLSTGPTAVGHVSLIALGVHHEAVVARSPVDEEGRYVLIRTVRELVPGRISFRLEFRPSDAELYTAAEDAVTLTALSPLTYPFARVAADRHVTFADRLVPFWSDGSFCAVGCRPVGVVNGWPLKPFHQQHALRAGLNERRLSGFHVGIDIMTGVPQEIYAIQSGIAHVLHVGDSAARVRIGNYIYWHVNLRVHDGQYVHAYRTVVGYSFRWTRHLHLSEVAGSDSRYLNPLRPGGRTLEPWSDVEPPVIGRPSIAPDGSAVVEVFDPQSFVPKIYYETPVLAPAAVAYRLFKENDTPIGDLEWALRGSHWIPNALASLVFAPSAHSPGFLCFARNIVCKPVWTYRLAGGFAPRLQLEGVHGRVRLTVYAWDWAGNVTARDTWLHR